MGKKKDKKTKKVKKYPSKVEETVKKIQNIEAPEVKEFKIENENKIDRFRTFRNPKDRLPLKEIGARDKKGTRRKLKSQLKK